LIASTIKNFLGYTEGNLQSASISIPAISSRVFRVQKIDVVQAMHSALLEFDGGKPICVKEVCIVNIDAQKTNIMKKKFAWWFGGMPKMPESPVLANGTGRVCRPVLGIGTQASIALTLEGEDFLRELA